MIHKWTLMTLLLVLLHVDGVYPGSAVSQFNEAFIMFTVSRVKGNSFYKVLVDDNEDPYLDVADVLANYFDLTDVRCEVSRKYCEGVMQPGKNIFWLDGRALRYGDQEEGSSPEPLPEDSIIVQDGRCWLKYDVFAKWFPTVVKWNLSSYYLSFVPEFRLLSERLTMRQQELKRAETYSKQREIVEDTEPMEPDSKFRPELKYHFGVAKRPQQGVSADLRYDLNVDVFKGTLQNGMPLNYYQKDWETSRPYWLYRWKDKSWFDLMEFGDSTFQEADLLVPNVTAENGFRFDSREIMYGEGKININERATPGANIDIYRDGIYMGSTTAGSDGRYYFSNIVVNGQSRVLAKIYYPDGSEEFKEIVISDDNGMVLPSGKFEERAFTGETIYGRLHYMALRYGLLSNVSMGLSALKFPGVDRGSMMGDVAMRPLPFISFLGQGMFTGKNIDRAFRVNTTLLYPNFIQVEHRYYSDDTPAFLRSYNDLGEYWSVTHSLGIGRIQFINEYEQDLKSRSIGSELIYNLSRYFKPFINFRENFPRGLDPISSTETGLTVMLGTNTVFEASRLWMKPYSINNLSFLMRDPYQRRGWNVSAVYSIPDKKLKGYFNADISYRIMKNISVGLLVQDKYFGAKLDLDGVLSPDPGPELWSEFGTGTIAGKVMSPSEEGVPSYPIEGAFVNVGTRTAITDDKGEFLITAISPYDKFMATVEPNSLDASVTMEKEFEVVYFRPGTAIVWNPKLVSTVGIDGVLLSEEILSPALTVEAQRSSDGAIVSTGNVESDGFFVIEKLTPGKYRLKLLGYSKEVAPIEVDLPKGTSWLSDIRWDLSGGKSRVLDKPVEDLEPKSVVPSPQPKRKVYSGNGKDKESRYYSIGGKPLYIAQITTPSRAIEGRLVGKDIKRGLIVEAVSIANGKVVSTGKISRDGTFIVDKLKAGEYELRLKGTDTPPRPLKVRLDDEDVLSGVRWEW